MSPESKNNSRRKFLIQASAVMAGSVALPLISEAKPKRVQLTILHTNDTHSQVDPFESNDPKYPGMGGVARRAEIIRKIRGEEDNVLLFDSGDIYQGTPYFNIYGGSIEFKLMSMMQYDAATMGNHDFDIGLEGFLKNLPHAKFPFLCSNYDFTNTMLEGRTQPYKIFEMQGVKIGVFGIGVQLNGLVLEKQYGETKYLNPIDVSNDMARMLKEEKKCHYVICLSHQGYDHAIRACDTKLAAQTKNLDLILGGHSHTFLDQPVPFKNLEGKEVLVAQTGFAGIRLGRIDLQFDFASGAKGLARNEQIKIVGKA